MKKELLFIKIIFSSFVFLLFTSHAGAQTSTIASKGDLAEYLWSSYEVPWENSLRELLAADGAGIRVLLNSKEFSKDRGKFFVGVSRGTIDEYNAGKFFEELKDKYITIYRSRENNYDATQLNYPNYPNYLSYPITPIPDKDSPEQTQNTCNPSCSNIGFQNSTLSSWSAWYGVDGSLPSQIIVNSLTGGACGSVTDAAGPDANTEDDYQVSLMTTSGSDPVAGPLIPFTPPLGGICARVGDGPVNGFGVGLLQQTYIVDASNPILTIQYAVVMQNPGHPGYQQPWFRISLLDQNGDTIPGCAQYFVVAGAGNAGFKPVWNAGSYDTVYCRPWTTAFVPLDNYIGQCVTVQYEASDCAMGGHFCYAYVAATCSKLNLVSSSDVFCSGQKSALIAGPPGDATYQWTTPDGCISGSNTQQALKVTCAGTYDLVTVSSAGAQCVDSFSITMPASVAGPPPVPCFKADTVCSGNPTHFNASCSIPDSGVTFYWDFYNNGIYEDSSGSTPVWTYSTGGLYNARLHILSPGGCSNDTVVTVAVDSTDLTTFPTVTDSIINATSCNACNGGVYITLSAFGNTSGLSTYYIVTNSFSNWRDSVTGFSAKGTGSGTCDTSITNPLSGGNYKGIRLGFTGCLCPGTYYFTIKSSKATTASKCNPGGLIGDTVQFVVGSVGANISSNVITSSASCGNSDGSATVTALGGTAPYTYIWSSGLGTGQAKTNLAAGTYTVAITDSNNCIGSATVKIPASPQLPAVVTPYYISCFGANDGSIKVTPTGGVFPYIYSWAGNASTTDSAGGLAPRTYSVTITDSGGCSGTFATTIIEPTQLHDSVLSSVTTISCAQKGSATFGVTGGSLPYTYIWSDGTASLTDTNLTAGTATIAIEDASGCTIRDSITVMATNAFTVNAGPDTTICLNDSVQINVSGVPGGSTVSWSPSSGLSCNNCTDPFAKPPASTIYIVTAVNGSCSSSDTILVGVAPSIKASVNPIDTAVCPDNFVQLQASGGTVYQWNPASGLNDSTIANPVAFVTTTITYTVTVSGASCNIAEATASITAYPTPPVPDINNSNDTLYCKTNPVYISYQWYFNDTLISGATNTFYFATQGGNYNVAVMDTNGCSIAVGINVIVTGMENFTSLSSVVLSPNPVLNQLTVYGLRFTVTHIEICNFLGQVVQRTPLLWRGLGGEADVSSLPPGIYFLQLQITEGRVVKRFVKE